MLSRYQSFPEIVKPLFVWWRSPFALFSIFAVVVEYHGLMRAAAESGNEPRLRAVLNEQESVLRRTFAHNYTRAKVVWTPDEAARVLDSAGIEDRAFGSGYMVVYDQGGGLRDRVARAARELSNRQFQETSGTLEFVKRADYDRIIRDYEAVRGTSDDRRAGPDRDAAEARAAAGGRGGAQAIIDVNLPGTTYGRYSLAYKHGISGSEAEVDKYVADAVPREAAQRVKARLGEADGTRSRVIFRDASPQATARSAMCRPRTNGETPGLIRARAEQG